MKVYPCPLPHCDWTRIGELPYASESEGALADIFGTGVFGAYAKFERLRREEETISAHLRTHTVEEFAIALAESNKRQAAEFTASDGAALMPDATRIVKIVVGACGARGWPEGSALWMVRQLVHAIGGTISDDAREWPAWLQALDTAVTALLAACPTAAPPLR